MKLYLYYFRERYYITTFDPNTYEDNTIVYLLSKPNLTIIKKLQLTIEKWEELIIKYNGAIDDYLSFYNATFPTKEDAENFIKELIPYLVMATLTEE